MRALINAALYSERPSEQLPQLFPAGFHPDLNTLLTKLLAAHLPVWRDAASRSLVRPLLHLHSLHACYPAGPLLLSLELNSAVATCRVVRAGAQW